jgi:hypothetical protein
MAKRFGTVDDKKERSGGKLNTYTKETELLGSKTKSIIYLT